MNEELTLYDLQAVILQATDDLESIDDPEVAIALENAVEAAMIARGEKLDRIGYGIFEVGRLADDIDARATARELANRAEEQRLRNRAIQLRKVVDRMKNTALRVLASMPLPAKGVRRLEGEVHTFKAKAVADSVEVYAEGLVPDKYKKVTVTMTAEQWAAVWDATGKNVPFVGMRTVYEVSKTALKPDLEKRLKCTRCGGAGDLCPAGPSDAPMEMCDVCEGAKTVPNIILGARLITGKLRLEVS